MNPERNSPDKIERDRTLAAYNAATAVASAPPAAAATIKDADPAGLAGAHFLQLVCTWVHERFSMKLQNRVFKDYGHFRQLRLVTHVGPFPLFESEFIGGRNIEELVSLVPGGYVVASAGLGENGSPVTIPHDDVSTAYFGGLIDAAKYATDAAYLGHNPSAYFARRVFIRGGYSVLATNELGKGNRRYSAMIFNLKNESPNNKFWGPSRELAEQAAMDWITAHRPKGN